MNRVTTVAATLAAATMATAAAISPAMAAARPVGAHPTAHQAAHPAAHARTAAKVSAAAQHAKGTAVRPDTVAGQYDGGKYVTIVRCQGAGSPPPVHLGSPGTPLIVSGVGPSAVALKKAKEKDPYKTVYTCTVTVMEKVAAEASAAKRAMHKAGCEIAASGSEGRHHVHHSHHGCTKPVTLNTGFGGLAALVKNHHPAA